MVNEKNVPFLIHHSSFYRSSVSLLRFHNCHGAGPLLQLVG